MINEMQSMQNSALVVLCVFLAYLIAMLLAITFHEFAHAYAAHKCGDDTAKLMGRMTLNPFKHMDFLGAVMFVFFGFGWAKPVPINPNKFRNYKKGLFWVSISGIIANIILAIVCSFIAFWFSKIMQLNYFYFFMYMLFSRAALLNVSFALFNLLPIYPLDGFNAIAAYAKYDNKYVSFMRNYGYIVLMILLLTGLFSYVYIYVVENAIFGLNALWGLIFG